MATGFAHETDFIKHLQSEYVEIGEDIDKNIKTMSKEAHAIIKKEWKKRFGKLKVHFLSCLEAGCHTNKWDPLIAFYTVDDLAYCNGKFYKEITNTDADAAGDFYYGYGDVDDLSFDPKEVKKFLKDMTKELGIKCELVDDYTIKLWLETRKQ